MAIALAVLKLMTSSTLVGCSMRQAVGHEDLLDCQDRRGRHLHPARRFAISSRTPGTSSTGTSIAVCVVAS